MKTGDLIGLLGWIGIISFFVSMASFFMKYINKKYINKLGKDKKQIVDFYKKIMKIVIKSHKLAGLIAILSVAAHFIIAFSINRINISGIVAALFMSVVFISGVYGVFISKNYKGLWLRIHQIVALTVIIAIAIHIL